MKIFRHLFLLFGLLAMTTLACSLSGSDTGPPRNAAVVNVVANTGLQPWLETAVINFNDSETETSDGKTVYVQFSGVESGQAAANLAVDNEDNSLWIPDDLVWVNLLAEQGNSDFQNDCVSVAESPLVIGMWRPVAELLGWPSLPLGWLDIGSLAADPGLWNYYSGGEYGDSLRLSHTHPGLSGTGVSTLLAIVQAAESKAEAVSVDDIQQPIVQASVGAFESAVTWFSTSTDLLGSTMKERGASYLGAAVMYESTAVYYGPGEIIPIYPLEGTFVATHPACVNQNADSQTQEAASLFRDYLIGTEGQETAVAFGLRPVNSEVIVGAPLDASNGVDLNQPAIVFNNPTVDTVYAVQELWQTARKDVNLVMLLDTSGSMRGDKMDNMRTAAVQFVEQMGDDDYLSIIAFATEPQQIIRHVQVGENRRKIVRAIEDLEAFGDTTLFDAIGDGATLISETTLVDTTNALVVLTDGQDTRSYRYSFNQNLISAAAANNTTVFTIAYGSDADTNTLSSLATAANGNYFLGDEASIASIYEEMSAAFGGSVGVGR